MITFYNDNVNDDVDSFSNDDDNDDVNCLPDGLRLQVALIGADKPAAVATDALFASALS